MTGPRQQLVDLVRQALADTAHGRFEWGQTGDPGVLAEAVVDALSADGWLIKGAQIWKVQEIDWRGPDASGDSVEIVAYVDPS